jgi:DNA-directed RNA polymerase subunit RPC12/RpoP
MPLMDISFNCPHCHQHLAVDQTGAGMTVSCPNCNERIMIPLDATSPPPVRLVEATIPKPQSASGATTNVEAQYWLERDGNVRGPYSFEILAMMWTRKELRLTDRLCKEGTESWIEVTRVVKSLDQGAYAQSDKSRNPPSFGFIIFLSALLPIIGLIMGVAWLSQPRFRGAGGALLAISLVFMLIWCLILFR